MISSSEQAKLAKWLSAGRGMLLRYADLLEAEPPPVESLLREIIAERTPFLDQLEARLADRGDLPPAGGRAANVLKALIDGLIGRLLGDDLVQQRLLHTEQHWAELLASGKDLAWRADERDLLRALQHQTQKAIERLTSACAPGDDRRKE